MSQTGCSIRHEDAQVRPLSLSRIILIDSKRRAVKAKCHIIYCDTTHNSTFTVYLNIYQTLLLVALKYHAYIRSWKPDPKTRAEYFLRSSFVLVLSTPANAL